MSAATSDEKELLKGFVTVEPDDTRWRFSKKQVLEGFKKEMAEQEQKDAPAEREPTPPHTRQEALARACDELGVSVEEMEHLKLRYAQMDSPPPPPPPKTKANPAAGAAANKKKKGKKKKKNKKK